MCASRCGSDGPPARQGPCGLAPRRRVCKNAKVQPDRVKLRVTLAERSVFRPLDSRLLPTADASVPLLDRIGGIVR